MGATPQVSSEEEGQKQTRYTFSEGEIERRRKGAPLRNHAAKRFAQAQASPHGTKLKRSGMLSTPEEKAQREWVEHLAVELKAELQGQFMQQSSSVEARLAQAQLYE